MNKQLYDQAELFAILRDDEISDYLERVDILLNHLTGQAQVNYQRCARDVVDIAQREGERHAVFIVPEFNDGEEDPHDYSFHTFWYPVGSEAAIDNAIRTVCLGEFVWAPTIFSF